MKIEKNINDIHHKTNLLRSQTELLQSRLRLLNEKDRLIMRMYLKNGNSYSQIANLAGVNQATISRRIKKIAKTLTDSKFILYSNSYKKMTRFEKAVAKDYFLKKLSIRKIAKSKKKTFHEIHTTIKRIKKMINSKKLNKLNKA